MTFHRPRPAPRGYTSWRAYWIELAIVLPAFGIGILCVALASIGAPAP